MYRRQVLGDALENTELKNLLSNAKSLEEINTILEDAVSDNRKVFETSYGIRKSAATGSFEDPWQNIRDLLFILGPDGAINQLPSLFGNRVSASSIPCNYRIGSQFRGKIAEYRYRNITSWMFIDNNGRPAWSVVFFRDRNRWPSNAPRQDGRNQCQPSVGRWGSGSSSSYDGGHLVPSRLNGYGGRTNLVPQDSSLNRGMWNNSIEATSFFCINRVVSNGGKAHYWVTPLYEGSSITPSRFEAHITWNIDRDEEGGFAIDNELSLIHI